MSEGATLFGAEHVRRYRETGGEVGSNRLYVFAQTTPARSRSAIQRIRDPFSVQTPAESPYGVLFAFSTASSGVRKVSTERTGPKISSCAIR